MTFKPPSQANDSCYVAVAEETWHFRCNGDNILNLNYGNVDSQFVDPELPQYDGTTGDLIWKVA